MNKYEAPYVFIMSDVKKRMDLYRVKDANDNCIAVCTTQEGAILVRDGLNSSANHGRILGVSPIPIFSLTDSESGLLDYLARNPKSTSNGHGKENEKTLSNLGLIRTIGFGKFVLTGFGQFVYEHGMPVFHPQ